MRAWFSYSKYVLCLSLIFVVACATIPTLNITYKTIPKSTSLEGREIYFSFSDERSDKTIIGKGASEPYKNFPGNIHYILSRGDEGEFLVGIYDVETLFKKTFSAYLGNTGISVRPESKPGVPELAVKLYDFALDLSGRTWISKIYYEAELTQDGNAVTRKFKVQAEKYRIRGLTQAHQLMSETYTDMVNQLDIKRLLSSLPEQK